MIRERLAGKTVLVTGVTGFLGEALLERLTVDVPDARLVLVVRPHRTTGRHRVEQLLRRKAFVRLRERHGEEGLARLLDERVEVIEGDVSRDLPPLPAGLDVVFHCAASVSFDPPVDVAFRTNVLGTAGLYEGLRAAGARPHVVHVSTAYVAGVARGVVAEAPLEHHADWRRETEAALHASTEAEESSRRPEMLERFLAESRKRHERAGPQAVARHAERRRREWVSERLVRYGRARARTLGWPDVYTLTKALGERVAEEHAADVPVSIVRPSIIESALRHPYPGWIEGFKMADPIIVAYGQGMIPEFPGIPEGTVDIIPVDLAVNAMLAVAGSPPDDGAAYYHVSSGSRNPLQYVRLFELVREYFRKAPLPDPGRGTIRVPDWRFPGKASVERLMRGGERLLRAADALVDRLPRSERTRGMARRVDEQRERLDFVRRYADLYGLYTEAEVIYTDERTMALFRSLPPKERREFGFDAAEVDWRYYIQDVHCPSVTEALRRSRPRRRSPAVRVSPRPDGVLAVFDLEGTILASNVVESYLWLRLADLPGERWPEAIASLARRVPRYLWIERRDRGDFLRAFYRRYEGASVEGVRRLVAEHVSELLLRRASPRAIRRIREHRAAGHRTILITGALDVLIEPFRPLFDDVVAARLAVRDGRYTGYLEQPSPVGEARAAWLRHYAAASGADREASYAYADSHSDLPLLRAVGHPVAVNPDVALYRVAQRRRWPVEDWPHPEGTPRVLLPRIAP